MFSIGHLGLSHDQILQLWLAEEDKAKDLFKKYKELAKQQGVRIILSLPDVANERVSSGIKPINGIAHCRIRGHLTLLEITCMVDLSAYLLYII